MRKTMYIVIQSRGHWWIDCEGKPYGPFDTEAEAIAEGPEFITLMGNDENRNELYVRDETGHFQLVWSNRDTPA